MRRKSAQGVLNAVSQLAENGFRHIKRVLGDKVNTHALGTDQTHYLFDLFQQGFGRVVKQQMGLVEKKYQFGFIRVAHFRQLFKKFGQHPQQEGGVELGIVIELVGNQYVDNAASPPFVWIRSAIL